MACCHTALQGRWARHEEELEKAASSAQVLSMEQGKASKRQIFSRWVSGHGLGS
jgi:hypothetical protein